MMYAAEHKHTRELLVGNGKRDRVSLDKQKIRPAAVKFSRRRQHGRGDVDAHADPAKILIEFQQLAMAATYLGRFPQIVRIDMLQENTIEIGHVFLSVRIAQILRIGLRNFIVVIPLARGVFRADEFGEQRNAVRRYAILSPARRHWEISALFERGPGHGTGELRQDPGIDARRVGLLSVIDGKCHRFLSTAGIREMETRRRVLPITAQGVGACAAGRVALPICSKFPAGVLSLSPPVEMILEHEPAPQKQALVGSP